MFYLMGGPGVIMSRALLQQLRPHLSYCIQHMFSPHEDIELGRCVRNHVKNHVTPIAWEILDYFYQHYDKVPIIKNSKNEFLKLNYTSILL